MRLIKWNVHTVFRYSNKKLDAKKKTSFFLYFILFNGRKIFMLNYANDSIGKILFYMKSITGRIDERRAWSWKRKKEYCTSAWATGQYKRRTEWRLTGRLIHEICIQERDQ